MRGGIVCSSAGQTFNELCRGVEHLGVAFTVITDRGNPAIQTETMLAVVRELEEARGIRVTV